VQAALELFSTQDYDEVTVARIAELAGVSTRTFFSYFRCKEDVLFADTQERVDQALREMAVQLPGESPVDMLLRATRKALLSSRSQGSQGKSSSPEAPGLRLRMNRSSPQIQAGAMRRLQEIQQMLTRSLLEAFPGRLTGLEAAALVGAFVGGAVNAVLFAQEEDPDFRDYVQVTTDALDVVRHRVQELDTGAADSAQDASPREEE
jgi:AcrR family transcriptional regulator